MKKNRLFLIFFTLISISIISGQVIEEPFEFSNGKIAALGGIHTARADDYTVLFSNPAGLGSIDFEMLLAQVTVGLSGPIFDMTNAIIQAGGGSDITTNPSFLSLLANLFAKGEIVGPIAFAYVSNGFGIGLFNWGNFAFEKHGPLAYQTSFTDNILLTGGYSFRFELPADNKIDIGVSLKTFGRFNIFSLKSFPEFLDAFSINPGLLFLDGSVTFSIGGGADFGVLYSLGKILSVGIAAKNVYSPCVRIPFPSLAALFSGGAASSTEYGIVPFDLSAGVRFSPPLGVVGYYISDVSLYLDYVDIFDMFTHPETAKNWLLHFNAGLELKLLDVLSVRGGISEGLFAAGLGLDLGIFTVDASMFGSEESGQPGVRPVYNMILSLAFRL